MDKHQGLSSKSSPTLPIVDKRNALSFEARSARFFSASHTTQPIIRRMVVCETLRIGERLIGDDYPVFVIAEAGANFRISDSPEENFRHALRLIDIAAEAKADSVKFQLYRAERLYVEDSGCADYIGKKKPIYHLIREMEMPYEWLPRLKEYCDKKKIIFLCSPFDEQSADELEKIGIAAYKIASYTITHIPLIRHIAKKGKPIILSTGASNADEIGNAISVIKEEGNKQPALLQCTAKYPAPLSAMNLRTIPELRKRFNVITGLSDHSREPYIAPLGAVALGAKIIEKHFTIDNSLPGPDHGFAILGSELISLVADIRKMELSLGNSDKALLEEEKELFEFARRGIYSVKDIKKGEVFSKENIAVLRGGKKKRKLEPSSYEGLLGRKAAKDIGKGEAIAYECIKSIDKEYGMN